MTILRFAPTPFIAISLRRQFPCLLGALLISAPALFAASVTWTGAAGDNLWATPLNWSGGMLPASEDDVVINGSGEVTIRFTALGSTTVRSLQCQASFALEAGTLALTDGASFVNGEFQAAAVAALTVVGPASFSANGPTTDLGGYFSALVGGTLSFPTLRQLTSDTFHGDLWFFAFGGGSLISLSNVTNVVIEPGYRLFLSASTGGRIDLRRAPMTEGAIYVDAENPGSVIDLSGMTGRWATAANHAHSSVLALDGGAVLMPNVTALERVHLALHDDASVPTAQLGSFTLATLSLNSRTNGFAGLTNLSGGILVDDARLDLTQFKSLPVTNASLHLSAQQGGVIDFSGVTNIVIAGMDPSPGVYNVLALGASSGGRIDVSRVRVMEGRISVSTRNPGSVIDLSGLTGRWTARGDVYAADGAAVLIPNVTAMEGISLGLRDDASMPTAQLGSITDGTIVLVNRNNNFAGLTNFSGRIYVYDARAELPNVTTLQTTNDHFVLQVNIGQINLSGVTNLVVQSGYGLYLFASATSRIKLPHLKSLSAGLTDVRADGEDAVVDLSALSEFFSVGNQGSLTARNGGRILLPQEGILIVGFAIDFAEDPGGVFPPFVSSSSALVLYGQPWRSYRVESRDPSVPGSAWQNYSRVPLTSPFQIVASPPPRALLLRVHEFVADPHEMELHTSAPDGAQLVLFGVAGRSYRIETKTDLAPTVAWQNGPTTTMTNSFFLYPPAAPTGTARLYRARRL